MTGFLDLLTSMTLNDLEPLKKRFLVNFSQFLDAAHISTLNCVEMAGDRLRQSAWIVRLSRVRARQCTSTPSLQNGCIFGLQDAQFHVPMLVSVDVITVFH